MDAVRPLCDLHLHLDGSLSVRSVRNIISECGLEDRYRDLLGDDAGLKEKLSVGRGCRDLNEYLEKFAFPCQILGSGRALYTAVRNLITELKELGLHYAEIRFAPSKHGISQQEAVEAATAGLDDDILPARLILCCMRGESDRVNGETVELASKYLTRGVCALDLAGAEALYPTGDYEALFKKASRLDVPFTIHAGEAAGAQSVWKALEFGARRIGHGVRAVEDERLMEELARRGTVLELCPTSNINTCVFRDYESFPLRKLTDAGVKVCICSDNMAVSCTDVSQEYAHLMQAGASYGLLEKINSESLDYGFKS